MAARDFVVRWFGESVARMIEQFVEGRVFADRLQRCARCGAKVASSFLVQREACPVCGAAATNEMMNEALEYQRQTAMAAGEAAISEVEELDRRLSEMQKKG